MGDANGDDDVRAERIGRAMYGRDRAAQTLGMELLEVRAGFSRVAFVIRDDMLNGTGTAHGGFIFALADTAFAYACNSHGETCVALQCSISFNSPGRSGMRLVATARERSAGRRTGTYDVEVADEVTGTIVALFRGTSYRVNTVG